MGIPKKGSRNISVDEHHYRYMVSGNDGHIDLIVESNETDGQRLVVMFDYEPKIHGFRYSHRNQITPETVRKAILYSLKNNWTPQTKASILRIDLCDRKYLLEEEV